MSIKIEDMIGKKFNKLTVLEEGPRDSRRFRTFICQCDCEKKSIVTVLGYLLRRGNTKSCGCLQKQRASETNFLNLAGKTIGNLYVIEREGNTYPTRYKCRCSCGNICIVGATYLRNRGSLGCKTCCHKKGKAEASKRAYYCTYRRDSERRKNKEFKLSIEEFVKLCESNCFYCGDPPSVPRKGRAKTSVFDWMLNGIDRVDNSKGYIINNCVAVCKNCNLMKLTLSKDEFINHIIKINSYQEKKNAAK